MLFVHLLEAKKELPLRSSTTFLQGVTGDAENGCKPEVGWHAVGLLDAAYRSAAQDGEFVDVQTLYG